MPGVNKEPIALAKLDMQILAINKAKYPNGSQYAGIEFSCPLENNRSTKVRVWFKNPPDGNEPHAEAKHTLITESAVEDQTMSKLSIKEEIDLGPRLGGKYRITDGSIAALG